MTVRHILTLASGVSALALSAPILSTTVAAQTAVPIPYDQERGVYSYAKDLAEVSRSVVKVLTMGRDPNEGPDAQPKASGNGSGVIIDAARGEIITNNHVVENATSVRVELADGRIFDATVVGRDPQTDVALLTIAPDNLRAIELADSSLLRSGDLAFAIGYPFGIDQTLTMGIISGTGRSGIGDGIEDFIQTDAAVNPGNSGGALIDSRGRMIGINTAIYSRGGDNAGIAFAVPINMALAVIAQIREYGEVRRGRIGVSIAPIDARSGGSNRGARIEAVESGSPAAEAGLQQGDVIVEANGRQINTPGNLTAVIGVAAPGTQVSLGVRRGGQTRRISLRVAEPRRVEVAEAPSQGTQPGNGRPGAGGSLAALGATFRDRNAGDPFPEQVTGALVASVQAGSRAEASGLAEGDLVIGVNGQRVANAAELANALRSVAGAATLFVARGNNMIQIPISQ
ncbi:trypsin-like peptidase domain-containing protein [Pseudoblastomonas halimionae]|uniref:PDZ domain-containing protein n=1 Tax=Alteriqipengyuania halimionae TaxID=1926630 RepID=A0A6I4U1E3_9SPHN|nr:trypsin-like peptidase domain-containing protein [Alteriqipengyuania halimionae]MXP09889.1 PDZ domain-containing protein [Alteriqipengyuania halimionae]